VNKFSHYKIDQTLSGNRYTIPFKCYIIHTSSGDGYCLCNEII